MISYLPTLDAIPAPVANVSLNTNRITNLVDPSAAQDAATQNFVSNAIAAISQTNNSQVISGCGVVWTGNLNFTVAAGSYSINNVTYSISQTNLTLNTADPTNPRFDVIAVNSSNAAVVITGTPAANPLIPTVDPSTQLLLTSVYVPAGASQPGNITNLVQYAEDAGAPTEWNATTNSAGTINLASTNNPHSGTKCIEVTATGSGNYIQLAQGTGTVNLSNYNSLVFYIAPKAGWPSQKSLTISFLNAGTQQGNALTFQNGSFGFVSSNTAYQQIVIPLSNFNIGNTAVNQLKFLTAGGGSTFGFYMDDVSLQAGVMIGSQAFMVWKSPWSSQTAYTANNVVTDGRSLWLCLLPNTNSEPSESNTNWQWLSSQTPVTRTNYSGNIAIATTGTFNQPTRLQISGSNRVTVAGTGRLRISDPANDYYALYDPYIPLFRALGSTIIAQTIGGPFVIASANQYTAVTGRLHFQAVYIPITYTVSGIKYYLTTTGNYTASNKNRAGLYKYSSGSMTLVASTVDDGNTWKATANTFAVKSFSAQYVASAGVYFIGILWNSSATTQAPVFGVSSYGDNPLTTTIGVDFSNGAFFSCTLASQSDLPISQSISATSAFGGAPIPWLAVY